MTFRFRLAWAVSICGLLVACGDWMAGSDAQPDGPQSGRPSAEGASEPRATRPSGKPWNVVVITLDTTRADALGAYGQTRPTTPNLDRLAWDGVLFEAVGTSSPLTFPSHSTIFTGRQPYAHGVRSNINYVLADDNRTLAEVLGEQGYQTGAEISSLVLQQSTRITQGFEQVRDTNSPNVIMLENEQASEAFPLEGTRRVGSDISTRGIEFIERNRDRPFLLWLHYFDAHTPYGAPEPFASRFRDDVYLSGVAFMDSEVGRVIDAVKRLGLKSNTLVVVVGDHGEGRGEHDEPGHSKFVYESVMRVPLILWGPKALGAGKRVKALVRTADVTPTILDWLELAPLEDVQGVSLRPLIEGDREDLALVSYGESIELHRLFGVMPLRMIRDGRWKYIHKVAPELYDLEADPGERVNVADAHEEIVRRLRDMLEQEVAASVIREAVEGEAVDAATSAQLEALGYVAGGGAVSEDVLASLDLHGDDPNTKAADIARHHAALERLAQRDYRGAEEILRGLARQNPESARIRGKLAVALAQQRRFEEALGHFERAVEIEPLDLENVRGLGSVHRDLGREAEMEAIFLSLLERDPCNDVRLELADFYHARWRYSDEHALLRDGVEACPSDPDLAMKRALALATNPRAELRDGQRALRLAQRAGADAGASVTPAHFVTLAAAWAEVGKREEAVRAQREAVRRAKAQSADPAAIAAYIEQLRELEAGNPLRIP